MAIIHAFNQKHLRDPITHHFDLEHEELLVPHPEQWTEKVKKVPL